MKRAALIVLLLAAGCQRQAAPLRPAANADPTGLEGAAIQAGVIADPNSTEITGLYARETDRVCIVPTASAYRVGVFVDYGDQQHCSGTGVVTRVGETLHIELGKGGCSFDARFEGDRIVFPGRIPNACQQICERRASIAALDVGKLSESVSEASTMRDDKGRLLCANS